MAPGAPQAQIRIEADADSLFRAAAEEFVRCSVDAAGAAGRFTVALAGGSTPRGLYALLGRRDAPYRDRVPWDRAHLYWGDERHVPPDHRDSNYRMVQETLLASVPVPDRNVHRVPAERADASAAAAEYEGTLRSSFRLDAASAPRFDLVLLGLGPDGHTASLFPGSGALEDGPRLVAAPWVETLRAHRITMTPLVFNSAASVLFLVSGGEKAAALRAVLEGDAPPSAVPARAVRPGRGALVWLVDRAAAGLLGS